jgi:hypothetical protein
MSLQLLLQARIEELLDDKADLEYEIDVVERKVELLREEVRRQRMMHAGRLLSWRCSAQGGGEVPGHDAMQCE